MQKFLVLSLLTIGLMGCVSSKESNFITADHSSPTRLEEKTIPGPIKVPEVRKISIAKPGIINATKVANGVVDVLVDGRLESDSLEKENPVQVLIDEAVEKTAENIDTEKERSNTVKMPK